MLYFPTIMSVLEVLAVTVHVYPYNDVYLDTLFIIGISMIILSLVGSNKNKSIKEKLIFFVENFYVI
jgi:hypothetical protein